MEPDEVKVRGSKMAQIWLQIEGLTGGHPLEVPVTLQNLNSGVVTLEVSRMAPGVEGEKLTGHSAKLRLTGADGATLEPEGTLVWSYSSGDDRRQVILGLELLGLDAATEKALRAQIGHTAGDLKELWNRWDQVCLDAKVSSTPTVTYLVGGAVIVAGLALQYAGKSYLELLGYTFMVMSSMVLAARIYGFWGQQG